jgi:hypothetical protein
MSGDTDKSPQPLFPGGPLQWVTTVAPSGRLRLPVQVLEVVSWLRTATRGKPFDCIGQIGPQRQLVLTKQGTDQPSDIARRLIARGLPEGEEDAEPYLEFARAIASVWKVTLSGEISRHRRELMLPRGARLLGLVPTGNAAVRDQTAVVFALQSRLEIWRHEEWVTAVAEFQAQRMDKLAVLEDLFDDVEPTA